MSRICRVALAVLLLGATPAALAGEPVRELIAADVVSNDNFGESLAIAGNLALVGSPRDDVNGTLSGSAYLFDLATGALLHKLVPDDGEAFDSFGYAVALSPSHAVVGAYKEKEGALNAGAAYVFDTATGNQLHKLIADDASGGASLGISVAVDGNYVVAGAMGEASAGNNAGAAYVFDATTGNQLHKLVAFDGAPGAVFGVAVAASGTHVLVGASGRNSSQGAAYLFDAVTGAFVDVFTAGTPESFSYFGRSLALSGDTALVGAPSAGFGVETGRAFLIDVSTGSQLDQLLPADGADGDRFGLAVDLDGDTAVIGAPYHAALASDHGAAYVFDLGTGLATGKFTAPDGSAGDQLGWSVGVSGARGLVGAVTGVGAQINSGTAFGFSVDAALWDNLGQGKAGGEGVPLLAGLGDLSGGSDLCFATSRLAAGQTAFLVVGLSALNAPAKGGVLVPALDLLITFPSVPGDGELVVPVVWPAGQPSGLDLWAQVWVQDGAVFPPYAASNGITATTP